MTPFFQSNKSVEKKCVRICPECDGKVDEDGNTIEGSHCDGCVSYSSNEPCSTCGYMSCDQSC